MIRPSAPHSERAPTRAHRSPRRRRALAVAAVLTTVAAGAVLLGVGAAGAAVVPAAAATPSATGPFAPSATPPSTCAPSFAPIPPPSTTATVDTQAPTVPGKPVVTICGNTLYLTWAPSTDNVGVSYYRVSRLVGDVITGTTVGRAGWSTTSWNSYELFAVYAVDQAGNASARSEWTSIGTPPSCPPPGMRPTTSAPPTSGPDTQAPTAPGKPVVTVANGVATVTWAASTDNVGVVTYQVYHEWTDIAEMVTVAAPATSRQFTLGSTSYHTFSVVALDAAGNRSASSGQTSIGTPPTCPPPGMCVPTSAPPTSPRVGTCSVGYSVVSHWQGAFQGEVRIRNTGTAAVRGWSLGFSFPGGQQISQIWGATQTQSGAAVTARNLDWNATIAPGATVTFGFIGSWTGSNASPTAFTLNGSACAIG